MRPLQSGGIKISRLVEAERVLTDPAELFPGVTDEIIERNRAWLGDRFLDEPSGKLVLAMQSFVIQTGARNIVVDTGIGNHKRRLGRPAQHDLDTPYLRNLTALGLQPKDIDFVVCTHLHADHVGWNTMAQNGQWVPTFPNAKYLFGVEDFDILNRRHQMAPPKPGAPSAFVDSILPVIDARQALLVEMDHIIDGRVDDGVWLEGTPGHTAGHTVVQVKSGSFHVILAGDIMHHPLQLAEPQLAAHSDGDKAEAQACRRLFLKAYADTKTIILPAHFAAPVAGCVVSWGDGYRMRWVER